MGPPSAKVKYSRAVILMNPLNDMSYATHNSVTMLPIVSFNSYDVDISIAEFRQVLTVLLRAKRFDHNYVIERCSVYILLHVWDIIQNITSSAHGSASVGSSHLIRYCPAF